MTLATYTARIALRAAALVAAYALPAFAQTAVTTGGVEVRGFVAPSSTDVYAAAYGAGLHRSTDAGATWLRIDLPGNERYLTSIDAGTAYVIVGGDEGLLRSTNGTTFTRILYEPVAAVAVAPSGGTTVLAAIKGVGIARSTDGGATFTLANNSALTSLDMTAVVFHPNSASTAYAAARPNGAGSGGGVYSSSDGGQTWSALAALPTVNGANHVTSLAVDSAGTIYAGVLRPADGGGDVYRLTGGSWSGTPDAFGVVSLHRDANAGTTIWAGSRYLGLRSGSGGNAFSYTFANNGANPTLLYTAINAAVSMPSGSQVVMKAIRGAGVWRSTATGSPRAWTRVSFPGADRVLSAASVASSSSTFVAGLQAGGVWRTSNSGTSWTAPTVTASQADFAFAPFTTLVNPFASIWDLAASTSNANLIYAAAGGVGMFHSNDNPGVFRWDGTAWRGIGNNANASAPWNGVVEGGPLTMPSEQPYGLALMSDDQTVHANFLGISYGILRRSGGAWAAVAVPGIAPLAVRSVVKSSNPSKLLALLFDDKPALSTNGGSSYAQTSVSQTGFERLRYFGAAENPANANVWIGATNKGVFRSADGGVSWTRVSSAAFQQQAISAVGFKSNGVAFAADFDGNRYCSTALSSGQAWSSAGAKLRAGVNALRNVASSLYYLTDGAGMFREDGNCP